MQVINNEHVGTDWVTTVNYKDLIAIGTGGTKIIGTIPAGGGVEWAYVVKTIAAAGSTSVVLNVGTTLADPDEFIDALDADGMTLNLPTFNTGDVMVQAAGTTTVLTGLQPAKLTATALPIYLKLTDAAVASLTAGEWKIGIRIMDTLKFKS